MKGAPMSRHILHFLLIVFFILPPCLAFAEELTPTTTDPAYPSSPPKPAPSEVEGLGGKEGGSGAMEFKPGEVIVGLREAISQASIQSLLLAEDIGILDEMGHLGLMLLSVPEGQELEKIEELERNPLVEYAEPNYVVRAADSIAIQPHSSLAAPGVTPNDPYFSSQWNLPRIEAPAAWDITTGSDEVVIAFVDTGVDLEHPEFRDKIWTNTDEIPDNGADDDGNGYVDDVHGWDFVNWDGEPQDDHGHGTFVASIAAAETNDGLGMAGVSWGGEVMPIKVFAENGQSYYWHITGGITYATDNGARIINLSWRLKSYVGTQPHQTAINYAHSKGVLIVAASGGDPDAEDPVPLDAYQYPAALDNVVSVAATNRDDGHYEFSAYNDKVDIAAPGGDILGVWLGFGYGRYSSTGLAAPHVSGLAALVWSVNPKLTPDEVESIIESTAVDLGEPGRDDYFGHGRIDASAAVMATTHYLQIEPEEGLPFLVCDNGSPLSRKLINPNTNSCTWSTTAIAPWLHISSPEGYTPSSATVSIDKGGLPDYGVYTALITATSTMSYYVNNPKTIIVTVNYSSHCWKNYLPLLFKGS